MQPITPIDLTSGGVYTIAADNYTPNPCKGIILNNGSAFTLTIGISGSNSFLTPGTTDYFPFVQNPVVAGTSSTQLSTATTSSAIVGGSVTITAPPVVGIYTLQSLLTGWVIEANDPVPTGYPTVSGSTAIETSQYLGIGVFAGTDVGGTALPAWVASVQCFFNQNDYLDTGASRGFSVTGNPSGLVYYNTQRLLVNGEVVGPQVAFNVVPGLDTELNYFLGSNISHNMYVVGSSLAIPQGTNPANAQLVTPTLPLIGQGDVIYQGIATTGTSTPVLVSPGVGFVWDISFITINCGSLVNSVAASATARGATTAFVYMGGYSSTAGIFVTIPYSHLQITEGLTLVNSTAVSAGCQIGAKLLISSA